MVTTIHSRLGIRLLGLLLLGVILACGILTYLVVRRERTLLMDLNQKASALLAHSITKNLREAMLEKDPAVVKRMLAGHDSLDGVKAAVFRNDGSLVYGDMEYRIPQDMITSPEETSLAFQDHLVFLQPLFNEKECHSCHNSTDRIRGIVAVRISTERVKREVDNTARHMVFFAVLTALLSGSGLILVLRKMVLAPLTTIRDGSVKIRDGDLSHRIRMERNDELGDLTVSFNQMAGKIENAQKGLEEAVNRKTKELRVIAELSTNVFRGDRALKEIIERFLTPVTENLGYSFCALCLIDKETGIIRREYNRGLMDTFCSPEITLADDYPFVRILCEAKPTIKRSEEVGISYPSGHLAIIPLTSHQKRRCRDINLCPYTGCPAFDHPDERCWLIEDTLCRSPHAVKGKHKIIGCLHCDVFPLVGVLLAGSDKEIGKSSLHSLEILASEVESAIENYRLIHDKKKDIQNLIRLHDISVERITSLQLPELTASIVSAASSFANADAALLWLLKGETLHLQDATVSDADLIPPVVGVKDSFMGKSLIENRLIETVNTREIHCLEDLIKTRGFLYAASVSLTGKNAAIGCLTFFKKNDFFMTDSEKAIITLFASQAASAITTAKIYGELKEQKELSDAVFGNISAGVMVLDEQDRVLRLNQAGSEILKVNPHDIIGRKLKDVMPHLSDFLVIDPGLGRETELPQGTKTVTIGFTNSPLLDMNEEKTGIVVVFRDLTEIKELQAVLRKKQRFEAMEKVISGVAHEVRNPLFAIQSIAQILDSEIESEQHQPLIKALLKESRRMKNLVDELLIYSRPSRLNISEMDFKSFFAEIKEFVKVKDRDAVITTYIPPSAVVRADRDKLVQVFLNLINNALSAGGRQIDIAVVEKDASVTVYLTDNGTGINEEDMEMIFDPFFTTKREGTGLGLPICRKIIEDHGGSIEIQSAEGKGTTVMLTFKS